MSASLSALIPPLAAFITFVIIMRVHMAYGRSQPVAAMKPKNPLLTPREIELTKPWQERLLKPLLQHLHGAGKLLTPSRNIDQLRHDLITAGLLERLTVIDFLGLRSLVGAGLGMVTFAFTVLREPLFSALLFAVVGFLIGLYLPNFWLRSRISKRQKAITLALPDALDRMTICVDAGLGFEAAIQKIAAEWDNELAVEFRRLLGEIRLGVPRTDALHHLVERTNVAEIASFVAVLVQADKLGIAIRDVLHTQSLQMRVRRRQRAEEAANKAPIKMMIPLALFIFPAMFAVILGPAIPRVMSAFK